MTHVIPNNVQETANSPGTGTLSLLGAVTGALDFDSQLATNDTAPYCIDSGAGQLEVGYGTFTAPSTLTRDTVVYSTNGGAKVNFTGTVDVIGGLPGDDVASLLDPADGFGFLARTAARTYAARTLTVTRGLTMTNPQGIAGDPVVGGYVKSIREFGAVTGGGGVTANNTAFAAAVTYLNSVANPAAVVFEDGIYEYDTSPNWGAVPDHCQILGRGNVRLRYSGTGNAFIVDGGAVGGGTFDLRLGPFMIEAPATAGHGIYWRAVHHAVADLTVRGCGSTSAGLRMEWGVLNEIRYRCSVNTDGGGFYLGAKPLYGMYLTDRSGTNAAYCYFPNAIVEGCETGIYLDNANGMQFDGGASEGNTTKGLHLAAGASLNAFRGMDFEANAGGLPSGLDVEIHSSQNVFEHVASDSMFRIKTGARFNRIVNSMLFNIDIETGAVLNVLNNTTYDRHGIIVGTFVDNGDRTMINRLINARTVTVNIADGRSAYNNDLNFSTEVLTGTSHIYTNNTSKPRTAIISGGLVTNIILGRPGFGGNFITMPPGENASQQYYLSPGDSIQLEYTIGFPPSLHTWDM